jgi:dolichol-phosphate mannosyltransferase
LAEIDLDRIRSRGYSFMEEILFWCRQVGCRIGETPILFENRRAGVTKINKAEAVKALQIILQLGIDRLRGHSARHGTSSGRRLWFAGTVRSVPSAGRSTGVRRHA